MIIWQMEPEFELEGQSLCDLCGRYWFDDELEDQVCVECWADIEGEMTWPE